MKPSSASELNGAACCGVTFYEIISIIIVILPLRIDHLILVAVQKAAWYTYPSILCALLVYVVSIVLSFYAMICLLACGKCTGTYGDLKPDFPCQGFNLLEIELNRQVVCVVVFPVPQ